MTNAPLCSRCGMRIWATDAPFAHTNCDEQQETWLTDEEHAEKAERIKAYERKKLGQPLKNLIIGKVTI